MLLYKTLDTHAQPCAVVLYGRYGDKAVYIRDAAVQFYQNVSADGLVSTALEHW